MIEPHLGGAQYLQCNALGIERLLKAGCGGANIGGPVGVAARVHVRGDDGNPYPRYDGMPRKAQSGCQVLRTVIDTGKQVAMKVNHAFVEEYPLL